MQLPSLFRRGVVTALDEDTDAQLATWNVEDAPCLAWIPLASDSLFNEVWDAGVLHAINAECGTLIADYEEEDLYSGIFAGGDRCATETKRFLRFQFSPTLSRETDSLV